MTYDDFDATLSRLDDLRRRGAALDRKLKAGELTRDEWRLARKPLLIQQHELEARLGPQVETPQLAAAETVLTRPLQPRPVPVRHSGAGIGAVARFIAALVTGLAAGIPVLAGIALESALIVGGIAWFLGPNWDWDGVEVFAWVFGVQAGLLALFAVPGVVVHSVQIARRGWNT